MQLRRQHERLRRQLRRYRRVDALPDSPAAKGEEMRKLAKADADALRKALLMPLRCLPERSMSVTLASDSRVLM